LAGHDTINVRMPLDNQTPQIPEQPQQPPLPPAQSGSDDDWLKHVVPINVSGLAIAAGYLGLFSLLLLPAPFALLFGIFGLRDIGAHPGKRGKGRAVTGIIFGGLFTALGAVVIVRAVFS
jgi:hypothetical protein